MACTVSSPPPSPPAAPGDPAHDALAAALGPAYTEASVAALLGVPLGEVGVRRTGGTLLGVQTADGTWAYPQWQFQGSQVDPVLVPVIRELLGAPAWSAALWWVTPNDDLGGAAPHTWVHLGRPVALVVASARRTAREWV